MSKQIDTLTLKETVALQKLLDQGENDKRRYIYTERLRTNIDVEYHYSDKAVRSSKLYSTEINMTDYYIMYALLILRIADAETVAAMLQFFKKKQPSLLINPNFRFVCNRLKYLTRLGFMYRMSYALNTKVELDDAYEISRQLVSEAREQLFADEEEMIDESIMDEDFLDDDLKADLSNAVVIGNTLRKEDGPESYNLDYVNEIHRTKVRRSSREMQPFGVNFAMCFGKNAYCVKMYALDDTSYQLLSSVLHCRIKQEGWLGAKLAFEKIGIAAAGLVTRELCHLPNFTKFKDARVTTKNHGSFVLLSETEFKMESGYRYNCGVFCAYSYQDEEKQLSDDARQGVYNKISQITNYLGIKGITKNNMDAFVIVCVNDSVDLIRFADACMKIGLHQPELERLYFTGEGIVREMGLQKVLQMVRANNDAGYQIVSTTLPIME